MRIVVDHGRCAGLGMCESFAPEIFEVDDHGELVLHAEQVPEGARELVDQAVEACPTQALSLAEPQ